MALSHQCRTSWFFGSSVTGQKLTLVLCFSCPSWGDAMRGCGLATVHRVDTCPSLYAQCLSLMECHCPRSPTYATAVFTEMACLFKYETIKPRVDLTIQWSRHSTSKPELTCTLDLISVGSMIVEKQLQLGFSALLNQTQSLNGADEFNWRCPHAEPRI